MNKKHILIAGMLLSIVLLSTACGSSVNEVTDEAPSVVDGDTIMTQVAQTVEAEITLAAALTPSATATEVPVEPTATVPMMETQAVDETSLEPTMTLPVVNTEAQATQAVAEPTGDDGRWIADVTVSDYEIFYENEYFKKVWKVKNVGTTTWTTDYSLVNVDDNNWGEDLVVPLKQEVLPGEEVNLSVEMRAPSGLGEHWSRWFLMNPNGQTFGQELYCLITVGTFEDKTPTAAG